MILKKLKESTKIQHERLEKKVNLMSQTLSIDQYKHIITKFHRFYSYVEPKILSFELEEFGYDFNKRSRLKLLEQDIKKLDLQPLASWQGPPLLESVGEVFGCLYVIEGSSLGGKIIGQHLKEKLGLTAESGASFFNIYGAETGKMWKEFGNIIESFSLKYQNDDQIIKGAIDTFQGFEECLTQEIRRS